MHRRKFVLLSVLCIYSWSLTTPMPSSAQKDPARLISEFSPFLVKVTAFDGEGDKIGEGHGFLFGSQGDLVTGYRLLAGAVRSEFRSPGGSLYRIKSILSADAERDLVRLNTTAKGRSYFNPGKTASPQTGDTVMIAADALSGQGGITFRTVSGERTLPGFGRPGLRRR